MRLQASERRTWCSRMGSKEKLSKGVVAASCGLAAARGATLRASAGSCRKVLTQRYVLLAAAVRSCGQ